jgi:hypothetical protein
MSNKFNTPASELYSTWIGDAMTPVTLMNEMEGEYGTVEAVVYALLEESAQEYGELVPDWVYHSLVKFFEEKIEEARLEEEADAIKYGN